MQGECEIRQGDIAGLSVHIAARVAVVAAPSEVLVTNIVKGLVAGSGIEFLDGLGLQRVHARQNALRPTLCRMEGTVSKIVHFEIPVDDAARASVFYREVLAWEISGFGDQPYWLVRGGADDEPGANGALIERGDLHRSPVLIAGVSDIDAALARVAMHGGKVLQGRAPVSGVGWSAYVVDSEGNTIGLFQEDSSASADA